VPFAAFLAADCARRVADLAAQLANLCPHPVAHRPRHILGHVRRRRHGVVELVTATG